VRLILIRHALPHRAEDVAGGADPGLTELGQQQAERVAKTLTDLETPVLFSSPQRRARETAEPLARALGLPVTVDPGLAEYDMHGRHYIPIAEMEHADPAMFRRLRDGLLPEGIDVAAFTSRVAGAFEAIAEACPGAVTAVCFSHAGAINAYLASLLGLARPLTFPLDYAGITRITVSRGGRRSVRTVNEIGHVSDLR
jgi:probable phosphoglycerate mutase